MASRTRANAVAADAFVNGAGASALVSVNPVSKQEIVKTEKEITSAHVALAYPSPWSFLLRMGHCPKLCGCLLFLGRSSAVR
jgi:hypothetical protein